MRPSFALRRYAVQLTLFTRANCGLCDTAKSRIVELQKKRPRPVIYAEVDIMDPGQQQWRDVYEFDVPVLHVERVRETGGERQNIVGEAKKLMHRFSVQEVERLVDEVEQEDAS